MSHAILCDHPGCQRRATWRYMPCCSDGERDRCDEHVPRGCSCMTGDDGEFLLDDQGRPLPCCEWEEDE